MNSVKQRLTSALAYLEAENRLETTSISEVCRLANVSRANVYATHREMVMQAIGPKALPSLKGGEGKKKREDEIKNVKDLEHQVLALRYICIELTLELEAERKKSRELANEVRRRSPPGRR